ncbi:MAG: class I SAM-dependent methyltransferase [bacterium]
MYNINEDHKWMEILSDDEKDSPHFRKYKRKKKRLQNLIKYIKFESNFNVAEFGCGNGIWGQLISPKIKSYAGIDFSEEFINLARKRHKTQGITNSQFYCSDIIKFAIEHNNEFDQAFSVDFSEHIYDDDFVNIFTAIKNTLKQGGVLYAHSPNKNYFLELLKKYGILKQSAGHIGIRNDKEYINLLRKVGFDNIIIYYLPHYIKLFSVLHFIGYAPIVGKFFKARLLIKCIKS